MAATTAMQKVTGTSLARVAVPRALRAVAHTPAGIGGKWPALSLPSTPESAAGQRLNDAVARRVRVTKGHVLVQRGEHLDALYAIRSGSCKSVSTTAGGHEQVMEYHIAGEVLGLEAMVTRTHDSTITALEDSEFCVMPFDRIEILAQQDHDFQGSLNALLSREIGRVRKAMLMLGTMRAEQRLASFLLDLSDRYQARGYSSHEFVLRMTRREIGSLLGLKCETVCRLFSQLHRDGLIGVQGREIRLIDTLALQQLADSIV